MGRCSGRGHKLRLLQPLKSYRVPKVPHPPRPRLTTSMRLAWKGSISRYQTSSLPSPSFLTSYSPQDLSASSWIPEHPLTTLLIFSYFIPLLGRCTSVRGFAFLAFLTSDVAFPFFWGHFLETGEVPFRGRWRGRQIAMESFTDKRRANPSYSIK